MGFMKDGKLKVFDFKIIKEFIKVFGVNLFYNINKCIEENFYVKIKKMKIRLNLWFLRDFTIYGKFLFVKVLGILQLVYVVFMLIVLELVVKIV